MRQGRPRVQEPKSRLWLQTILAGKRYSSYLILVCVQRLHWQIHTYTQPRLKSHPNQYDSRTGSAHRCARTSTAVHVAHPTLTPPHTPSSHTSPHVMCHTGTPHWHVIDRQPFLSLDSRCFLELHSLCMQVWFKVSCVVDVCVRLTFAPAGRPPPLPRLPRPLSPHWHYYEQHTRCAWEVYRHRSRNTTTPGGGTDFTNKLSSPTRTHTSTRSYVRNNTPATPGAHLTHPKRTWIHSLTGTHPQALTATGTASESASVSSVCLCIPPLPRPAGARGRGDRRSQFPLRRGFLCLSLQEAAATHSDLR